MFMLEATDHLWMELFWLKRMSFEKGQMEQPASDINLNTWDTDLLEPLAKYLCNISEFIFFISPMH